MSEQPANVRIHGMEVIQFSMSEPKPLEGTIFNFDVNAEVKLSPEQKLILVFVGVNVRQKKEDSLSYIKVAVGFEVIEFAEAIKKNEKGEYDVPYKLDAMVRRISISTTRGVLFEYLKGTYLSRAILPIVPELLKPQKGKEHNPSIENDGEKIKDI